MILASGEPPRDNPSAPRRFPLSVCQSKLNVKVIKPPAHSGSCLCDKERRKRAALIVEWEAPPLCHDKGGRGKFVKHCEIKYEIRWVHMFEGKGRRRRRQIGNRFQKFMWKLVKGEREATC